MASFVGFAPAQNPKLLISIMVDEPKGAIYGGQVAAPAFGKIASFALRYQKIPPSSRWQRRSRYASPRCSWATSSRTPRSRTSTSPRWPTTRAPSRPGRAFFCVRGFTADGHRYAPDAVANGAVALVVDHPLDLDVPEVLVDDVRAAMAPAAARLAGDPTAELAMVGITGTNGKTTTSYLTRALLEAAGRRTGLIGTVTSCGRRRRAPGRAHDARGDRPAAPRSRAMRDGGDAAR